MKKLLTILFTLLLGGSAGSNIYYQQKVGGVEDTVATLEVELALTQSELETANREKNIIKSQKQAVVDSNLWQRVRLGETPLVTPDVTLNEMEEAYRNVIAEKQLDVDFSQPIDLYEELREHAISKGEACTQ